MTPLDAAMERILAHFGPGHSAEVSHKCDYWAGRDEKESGYFAAVRCHATGYVHTAAGTSLEAVVAVLAGPPRVASRRRGQESQTGDGP